MGSYALGLKAKSKGITCGVYSKIGCHLKAEWNGRLTA